LELQLLELLELLQLLELEPAFLSKYLGRRRKIHPPSPSLWPHLGFVQA
jgi:hypothetical protein